MFFVVEVTKGATEADSPPLSAAEALRRIEEAEALGISVSCTDTEGNVVTKDDLRRAAERA
jgi:hypothetical protein